jgi:hypothetical protein
LSITNTSLARVCSRVHQRQWGGRGGVTTIGSKVAQSTAAICLDNVKMEIPPAFMLLAKKK